jgi:hypothetical protein
MKNIMNSIKTCLSSNSLRVLVLSFILLGTCLVSNVYAADPAFNILSNDIETLRLENRTTNPGGVNNPALVNWRDPISASAGDAISFDMYYHNGVVGTTATNTRIRIAYPTVASTTIITTGYIISDNAAQVSNTGTANVSTAQTVTFEGTAYWYPNQTTSNPTAISITDTGTYVEVNIGSVAGGWPSQGHVIFRANISNNPVANSAPTVDAGPNRDINESLSVVLTGTATDPDGDAMTYSWACNGGTLSSSTILTPTYFAPSVSSDVTYSCVLTATDSNSNSSSDSVSIIVRNIDAPVPGAPIVDAGTNRIVDEYQSITLAGTATDPDGDAMTYSWACNGGSISNSTTLTPIYYAPSVSSNTTYSCVLTATDSNLNSSADSVSITVRNITSNSVAGGGGSPYINVSLSASPSTGTSPLTGVDLTASVSSSGISNQAPVTYKFDCENNNSWELVATTTARNYTAQDLCNYQYDGTYAAKVTVEAAGYSSSHQINITVGYISGGGFYGVSADAGSNREIRENQSTTLTGSGYSQYGYSLGYYWTCNGGSISNSTTLTPIYYAPSVDRDTVYGCTLTVTDTRGYKNSDSVNITVRDSGYPASSGLIITTNSPEDVTGSSAVIKGTLNSDGGQPTSIRFNWGKLSAYNNFTGWISNKSSGQIFSSYISGLVKGKAYHYRIEATNANQTVVGQDVGFVTKPDAPTGFKAVTIGSSQINLNWKTGAASCYTMVTRKVGSYPLNSGDGTIVYYGIGNSYADKSLVPGTAYYYRAWSVACDEGLISFSESQYARANTLAGSTTFVPTTINIEEIESNVSVEALARNFTQKEIAWQNSILSSPTDEIEFKVIITPTGAKSLEGIVLKNIISEKIKSFSDIKVDNESYSGNISEINLGTVALGESKIITFKGKVDSKDNFSYGSNDLENTIEVSAKGIQNVKKTLTVSVSRAMDSSAGLIQFMDLKFYSGVMTILFIIMCLALMYLLIDRKRGKECIVEKEADTKVNKSKYFNIK